MLWFFFYPAWIKPCKHRQKCEQVAADSDIIRFQLQREMQWVLLNA